MKFMARNARLSYVRVFEASQVNGQGDATYSVCLLIDKNSPEGNNRIGVGKYSENE